MINLKDCTTSFYSQFNQDSVLEKIFETIGLTNKYFVEFGSYGNKEGQGNTYFLREKFGMSGLLMDGQIHNNEFKVFHHVVTSQNVNELFDKYSVPEEFDFLSIDIDGCDYYVWEAITRKPRVVSIECNPHYEVGVNTVQPNTLNFGQPDHYAGCSVEACRLLSNKKGYSLVAYCGVDAIFIRNDILDNIEEKFKDINDVHKIAYRLYESVPQQFPSP